MHAEVALEKALAFFVPVTLAVVGGVLLRQPKRVFAATLLSVLWCVPALLLLQHVNLALQWWSFVQDDGISVLAMPSELWCGWVVLWSAVPVLCLSHLPLWLAFASLALCDMLLMPRMLTVHLHPHWLVGEAAALLLVLVPSLLLQRWTVQGRYVRGRAALQVITAAGMFLYLPAELVSPPYPLPGWSEYYAWSPLVRALLLQLGVVLALPGVAAVQEFAARGEGTPIPYDPPQKLVTTGMYRYVANPMQLSCLATMLLWALLLRNVWLLCGSAICLVYCMGIARWDEGVDLQHRFGSVWSAYRAQVPDWLPRWRPYVPVEAKLYIARGCEVCSGVRVFLQRRIPVGVVIMDAETLASGTITRMRYVCEGETVEGVRAMGRALEHLNLGWAAVGVALRLPGVWWVLQMVLDVSGMGPREYACIRR